MASVHAFEDLVIASKATGRVVKLYCDLADRVLPKSLLLEIDPRIMNLPLHSLSEA